MNKHIDGGKFTSLVDWSDAPLKDEELLEE